MAVELPDEVIVEILSILPAKSLLRCRLVCKSWLNLINSTKFKLTHLHNFNQLNPRYFIRRMDYDEEEEKFSVHLDDEDFTLDCGFGYEKMSDDFKLVSLTYNERSSTTRPKVEVYTVKTGFWREVMFPHNLSCFPVRFNWSQVFSNGCVHWIASDSNGSHYSIMTFDITTELFGEIQLPEYLAEKCFLRVSVVGESLAVIHSSDLNFDGLKSGSTYMVTVMKEYKNPASWTKLYHIHYEHVDLGKPLLLRNNSDMIVELESRDIIMFNHDKGCYVYVFRDGKEEEDFDYMTYVDRYEESLALLDVGDSIPNKETMKALIMIENQVDDKPIPFAFQSESVSLWHDGLALYQSLSHSLEIEIEIEIEMEVELPDELIVQILSFLPAKSLLRCRSNYNHQTSHRTQTLTLPLPIFYSDGVEDPVVVLGFGHDKMSDDFNVVYDQFSSNGRPKSGSTYMVMVMKEHKNPASWTMLYHIHYEDVDFGKPLRLRNNSDMIVELKNRDMIMFNHDEDSYVYVFRDGEEEEDFDYKTYVDRYVESLALLDVGDSVPNKEAMKALMMIENQVELPDELIVQILSFLPAKSLLRWRSVSKSWLNLINSTKFKLMHLRNFNQLNPRYFVRRLDPFVDEEWFCVHLDDEDFTFDSGTQIELSFDSVYLCFWIVDCCNGVLCLCDYDEFNEYGFTLETIILWNPSIRRKLTLPLPMFYYGVEDPVVVLGFGYDIISDDYKVVSLTYDEDSDTTRPQAEVYTLKTGIWREVMFPHNLSYSYIHYNWSPIFFNGCVHWIASDSKWSHYSIMTFDITTELFGEFQLPWFLAREHFLKVSVVGDSLALIHSSGMKFDGLKSTGNVGKPLRLRNNSDMIVELENRDMIMFNHDEFSYVYVFRDGEEEEDFDYKTYVDRYIESLALLDVGDSVPNKEATKAVMMVENQGQGVDTVAPQE
ncbi:hypothetical protein OSB04_013167 [Centaurea solstitialis]|uniref:F-box domain-containing protein n=1 Tax=Centaurea solstitialis TaxID=347529 RepID=A0AA38TCR4_9ASTR|nr:hypothetical protein OSB04_013167 [Centaurea solstitialis]